MEKKRIINRLVQVYYLYQSEKQKEIIFQSLDSLYSSFSSASDRKFELGESNYLEKVTAKAKHKQIKIQFEQAKNDVKIAEERVKPWYNTKNHLF